MFIFYREFETIPAAEFYRTTWQTAMYHHYLDAWNSITLWFLQNILIRTTVLWNGLSSAAFRNLKVGNTSVVLWFWWLMACWFPRKTRVLTIQHVTLNFVASFLLIKQIRKYLKKHSSRLLFYNTIVAFIVLKYV